MPLSQKIIEDLKQAMKAKNTSRISCLRLLKTALKNKQVEKRRELEDEEIQTVISSLIRKGQEAAKEFRGGNRLDLAAKEEEEIKILYEYLPEQLTPADIEKNLKEIISELSATSLKDLGKVMKAAMARMAGKAQGKEVNEIARKLLS
ncbi:MAG: GatB/YqeY domain-containing protein [Deltaproteobacteria bacterium]|nr:MAG: GatB/YqeY domain-containing protein [Deltaproteobacteria bacterium]